MRAAILLSKTRCSIVCLAGSAFLAAGCATTGPPRSTARLHPSAGEQFNRIEKTVALTPEITLNELTAGGVREQRDDWTRAARAYATAEIERIGAGRIVVLNELELDPELTDEIHEVRALYRTIVVNDSVFGYTLPGTQGRFDYSVGSVDRILAAADADALLIVFGMDDYFTGGRQALSVLSFVAAAVTGVYVMPSHGVDHVSAALIARDGTLLWHDSFAYGSRDLRTPAGVQQSLAMLLRSLPENIRPTAATDSNR